MTLIATLSKVCQLIVNILKKEIRFLGIKIWEEKIEERSQDTGTLANPSQQLIDALGGLSDDSAVNVTHSSVLTLTAVWRAVNVISGTLASLPLHVFRKNDDGSRTHLADHPVQKVVSQPTSLMTDYIFRETLQASLLLQGDAFALIRRPDGKPVELIPVLKNNVFVFKNGSELAYKVRVDDKIYNIPQVEMIHIPGLGFDGMQGYSPIKIMADSMGVALAAQRFGKRFFSRGANMSGVIEVPGSLNDIAYKRLKDSWDEAYAGIQNSHKTAMLEGGAKYNRIGIPPEEAQFIQTRQFQVAEVARMFGVQPHLLMDLERSTNNNIEHQGIEFVTYTLMPWVKRWEAELNRKLFPEYERNDLYVEYNLTAILRGDAKSRAEYYQTMFAIGGLSPNEIRRLENQPAYDGGDQYFAQAGFMPIKSLESYYASKNNDNGNAQE